MKDGAGRTSRRWRVYVPELDSRPQRCERGIHNLCRVLSSEKLIDLLTTYNSIFLIGGTDADSRSIWTEPESGVFWPKDLLPEDPELTH